MTTAAAHLPRLDIEPRWVRMVTRAGAGTFITGSALNLVLTAVAPQSFADLGTWMGGPQPLQELWAATMGAHPRVWAPVVGVGYELAVGLLALSTSRRRRLAGLIGMAAFHVGLLAMGLWLWALPVLAILGATIYRIRRFAPRGVGIGTSSAVD